jgi:hypothetical protein
MEPLHETLFLSVRFYHVSFRSLSHSAASAMRRSSIDHSANSFLVDGQMEQYQVRLKGYQAAVTTVVSEVARKAPISFNEFARDHASYFRGERAATTP